MVSSTSRANLCRRRRQQTHTSLHVFCFFLVTMALITLSRGMVIKSGRIYRHGYYRCATTVLRFGVAPTADGASQSLQEQDPPILQIKPCQQLFDLELPEGRCLGLQMDANLFSKETIDEWVSTNCLHPHEVDYAMTQPSEFTQQTFLLGRLAMRQVLGSCCNGLAILKDGYGRPNVPLDYLGSISHKRSRDNDVTTGVALLSPCREGTTMGVGVDIELATSERSSIAKRVLTEHEIESLGYIDGVSADEEVLLRFSLKEAFYKAIHPLICQYVGFQEAEVIPHADGTATVDWNLKSGAHMEFEQVSGHWRRIDEFFLSSASVTLSGSRPDECEVNVPQ